MKCRWGCGAEVFWAKDQKGKNAIGLSLPPAGMKADIASDDKVRYRLVGTHDVDAKYIAHYANCRKRPPRPRRD